MTIWTFKPAAGLVALVMLGACEGGGPAAGLLAGLTNAKPVSSEAPLTQALMMRGQVTLAPPDGYCIDAETLRENFALLARCDGLGSKGSSGAPQGVMTVSVARLNKNKALPSPELIASTAGLGPVSNATNTDTQTVFQTSGDTPGKGLDGQHWRGAARIGPFILNVALFGPKGGEVISSEGAGVVKQLIAQTTAKSALE